MVIAYVSPKQSQANSFANNTTLPVPQILDVFKYNGTVHIVIIVQEFIDAPLF